MNKIEIPLSKTKLLLAIGGSLLFVLVGLYMITSIEEEHTRFNHMLVKGLGIASVAFFAVTGFYSIKKIFDTSVGLTINDDGIFDNSSASGIGLIKWTDITDIRTEKVASTKFLLIYTTNPDYYLDKAKGLNKKFMEANFRMYGTPIAIASTSLKYNFRDLEKLIKERLEQRRNIITEAEAAE